MPKGFAGQIHGNPPLRVCIVHGGPGGSGEVADFAAELAKQTGFGVIEPYQTQHSVAGQVSELADQIAMHASHPMPVIGWSWVCC